MVVGYRVGFQRASSVGQTIAEFARPNDRGVREMEYLYEEVFGEVYEQAGLGRVA